LPNNHSCIVSIALNPTGTPPILASTAPHPFNVVGQLFGHTPYRETTLKGGRGKGKENGHREPNFALASPVFQQVIVGASR